MPGGQRQASESQGIIWLSQKKIAATPAGSRNHLPIFKIFPKLTLI
jgi:hypothetical protein